MGECLLKSHVKSVLKKVHGSPGQLYPNNNLNSWVKIRVALTILLRVGVVRLTKMKGSSSDAWIYKHFGYTLSLNYT
jgi:hypothetical protein